MACLVATDFSMPSWEARARILARMESYWSFLELNSSSSCVFVVCVDGICC